MTKLTTLVISVSGVLNSLVHGTVTATNLEDAVFFVGGYQRATSVPALMHEIRGDIYSNTQKRAACTTLRSALDTAEQANRVVWQHTGSSPWEQLNELLEACQLPRITPIDLDCPPHGRYAYPWVAEAVLQQHLPYWVIWNGVGCTVLSPREATVGISATIKKTSFPSPFSIKLQQRSIAPCSTFGV